VFPKTNQKQRRKKWKCTNAPAHFEFFHVLGSTIAARAFTVALGFARPTPIAARTELQRRGAVVVVFAAHDVALLCFVVVAKFFFLGARRKADLFVEDSLPG
jgi:hypothetical protein